MMTKRISMKPHNICIVDLPIPIYRLMYLYHISYHIKNTCTLYACVYLCFNVIHIQYPHLYHRDLGKRVFT